MLKKLRVSKKVKTNWEATIEPAYPPLTAASDNDDGVSEQDVHDFLDFAKHGQWSQVEEWLCADRRRPRHVNDAPGRRWSALHQAAYWGSGKGATILLSYGADPMTKNRDGDAPSDVALSRGHVRLADRLRRAAEERESGRRASEDQESGRRASEERESGRRETLFRLLNRHPARERDLYRDDAVSGALWTDPDAARMRYPFLEYGQPVFPIFPAVRLGASADVVRQLCNIHPSALSGKTQNDWTLLHEACTWRAPIDTVQLLMAKIPEALGAQTIFGHTPLHLACQYGASLDVVRLIAEAHPGALGVQDNGGRTPLMLAEESDGPPELTEFLRCGGGGFYAKLMQCDDRNINFKIAELIPLIEDVHHARFFYTLVNATFKSGGITSDDRARYVGDGLRAAATTTTCTDSIALFKLLLRKASDDEALTDLEREKLDREAEVAHTSHAPFVRDLRDQIQSNTAHIDGLEANVDALDRFVERLKSGLRYQRRVEAVVGLMGAVLNAVSLGVAGSALSAATHATIGGIVDFGDVAHIGAVVESAGDTSVKDAFEVGLECTESCADAKLERAAAEASPIVAIAFAAGVMDSGRLDAGARQPPPWLEAALGGSPVLKDEPRLIDRIQYLEDQLSPGEVPPSILGRVSGLELQVFGSAQEDRGSLLERIGHLERELGIKSNYAMAQLHPI